MEKAKEFITSTDDLLQKTQYNRQQREKERERLKAEREKAEEKEKQAAIAQLKKDRPKYADNTHAKLQQQPKVSRKEALV